MNRSELHILETHMRNCISELEALVEHRNNNRADIQAADPDASVDAELELRIAEKDKQELARLQANLNWLVSDEGGCCANCGCDIPIARLRAVPATRLCVRCAR